MTFAISFGRRFWLVPQFRKNGLLRRFMWAWFSLNFYPKQLAHMLEDFRVATVKDALKRRQI